MSSIRRAALFLNVIALASPAFADTYTFLGGGSSTNWSDPTNWANSLLPVNSPATQIIYAPTDSGSSTLDTARSQWTVNSLLLQGPATSTVNISPGSTLSFTGPNPFIQLVVKGVLGRDTFTGSITSDSALTLIGGPSTAGDPILNAAITAPALLIPVQSAISLGGNNSVGEIDIADNAHVTFATAAAMGSAIHLNLSQQTSSTTQLYFAQNGPANASSAPITVNPTGSAASVVDFEATTATSNITYLGPLVLNGPVTVEAAVTRGAFQFASVSVSSAVTFAGNNLTLQNVSGAGPITFESGIDLDPDPTHLTTANTFTAPVTIVGELDAQAAGALPTSVTLLTGATISLLSTAAANADITIAPDTTNTFIDYAANNAANGHHLTANTIFLDNVSSVGADIFTLGPNGYLKGNDTSLALLTRGSNLFLPAGSTIQSTVGDLPPIKNLGTNADLTLAIGSTAPSTVTLGAGTPYNAFAGAELFAGTLLPTSNFALAGGTLGTGAANSFAILSSSPVNVTFSWTADAPTGSLTLKSPLSDFSGAASFLVTGTLTLASANDLGGGNSTAPVPTTVNPGGQLIISDPNALNANLLLHAGAALTINSAGLTGSGAISRDTGPIALQLNNSQALAGSQLAPAFIRPGDTLSLGANDIFGLASVDPAVNYAVASSQLNGYIPMTQAQGLQLNGTSLALGENIALLPAASGDNTLHVGSLGATITVAGTQVAFGSINPYGSDIDIPIVSAGTLTIGSTDPALATHGYLILYGASSAPAVVVNNAALLLSSPAAIPGTPITLNASLLALRAAVPQIGNTASFTNEITVNSPSALTDSHEAQAFGAIFNDPNRPVSALYAPALSLGKINLGADLQLYLAHITTVSINEVHLTADATLSSPNRTNPTAINSITADTVPHILTIQGFRAAPVFNITSHLADTGTLIINNATLQLDGTTDPSTNPLILQANSTLSGSAPLPRPIIISAPTSIATLSSSAALASTPSVDIQSGTLLLSAPQRPDSSTAITIESNATLDLAASYNFDSLPGPTLTGTGLVTIDPGVTLTLPIDTAFAGTIQINGTLFLAPPLNPANAGITPAFTLLNNVPEPASLTFLLMGLPLLRRRKFAHRAS